jgi:hypothetical protein
MKLRPRLSACGLAILTCVAGAIAISAQTAPADIEKISPPDTDAVLRELAPDTVPLDEVKPKPANRTRAIRLLSAVKGQETGWNRQLAIYLLASLGYDYAGNREELLRIWHHCVTKDFNEDCNEDTAMILVGLYRQGHKELLRPLLACARNSDGALSEELFPFYAEELARNPSDFVAVLAAFSLKDQSHICECAATGDGDGMPAEVMHRVLRNLGKVGGAVAARCARSYKAGNQVIEDNDRNRPEQPTQK